MERAQFTFYRSYRDALRELPPKEFKAAVMAICDYALDGKEPNTKYKSVILLFNRLRHPLNMEIRQSIEGRRCAEYKAWRRQVFERDDYTCRECGKRSVQLNAHHILPYAYFPDDRFRVDNGITLCVVCHKKKHRRRV